MLQVNTKRTSPPKHSQTWPAESKLVEGTENTVKYCTQPY